MPLVTGRQFRTITHVRNFPPSFEIFVRSWVAPDHENFHYIGEFFGVSPHQFLQDLSNRFPRRLTDRSRRAPGVPVGNYRSNGILNAPAFFENGFSVDFGGFRRFSAVLQRVNCDFLRNSNAV